MGCSPAGKEDSHVVNTHIHVTRLSAHWPPGPGTGEAAVHALLHSFIRQVAILIDHLL